tara:strand:+ start:71 stop:520 length:450 start_codon:yes stop_codon:yes gene_type:complete
MDVFGLYIPNKVLTNFDLINYVKELKISNFRGVFMRDTLPKSPRKEECGIVNFNTTKEKGSHWVCYYKKGLNRIYFDSFGQITPIEIQNYLKTNKEKGLAVIQRNTDIVQSINTNICGHLCLFVLKALTSGWSFQEVLNHLNGYSRSDR